MKNSTFMKEEICKRIYNFTNYELYNFITGAHPFKILICEQCMRLFGNCPEEMENDKLCQIRFCKWCEMER